MNINHYPAIKSRAQNLQTDLAVQQHYSTNTTWESFVPTDGQTNYIYL